MMAMTTSNSMSVKPRGRSARLKAWQPEVEVVFKRGSLLSEPPAGVKWRLPGSAFGVSPARSAFGLRWQGLRKAATPLSKPDAAVSLVGPGRKAAWASLTLLPAALPRRSARGTARPVFRAQRFRTAVARPSEGRDTAFETGRGNGTGGASSQSGVGVADAPTRRTPTALRAGNRSACLPRAAPPVPFPGLDPAPEFRQSGRVMNRPVAPRAARIVAVATARASAIAAAAAAPAAA